MGGFPCLLVFSSGKMNSDEKEEINVYLRSRLREVWTWFRFVQERVFEMHNIFMNFEDLNKLL